MALYRCIAQGIYPVGTGWHFGQYCSSALSLSAAASAWNTAVSAYWTGATLHHAPGVNLASTTVYTVDPVSGKSTASQLTTNVTAGTGVTAALPAEVSLVVTKSTVQPGPNGRGRMYLPPLVAGDLSNGLVLAGTITTMVAAVKAMYDSLVGASMTPVLYGLRSKIIFNLSGFKIGNSWDVQRRRQRKITQTYTTSAL